MNRLGQKTVMFSRTGLVPALLVLVLSACAGTPAGQSSLEERLPLGEAEEVFAAGFRSIADKYIDEVSVETLAIEGFKGLNALDPGIAIRHNGDTLEVQLHRRTISELPLPEADDADGWAYAIARLTADAQSHSAELANVPPEKLYEAVFDGSMGALDVFSRYAGKEEAGNNRAKRDGFGGIGVRFRLNNERIVVTEVMADTPAEKAGIMVGDELTAVGESNLLGLGTKTVVDKLRGPVGSTVNVVVMRKDVGRLELSIERSHIVPPTVEAEVRNDVLHMKISSFNQGTASSVVSKLRTAILLNKSGQDSQQNLKGIVLDLRGNPGGLLKQSIEVADAFLVHGDILNTQGRHPDSIQHYEAAGQDQALGLPMVVLIDGKSASAAEIVAAALQDRERAVVVGTTSYGKGTVQTVVRLPNSGEVTLTWSRFMAPSGYALNGLGVLPVICTSGEDNDAVKALRKALDTHDGTLEMLETWRTVPHTDVDARHDLRDACPPERHTDRFDVEVARALIEDGALYFRALDITSSTAHAVE